MTYTNLLGVGSIAYVEYARRLFPEDESDREINALTNAMRPGKSPHYGRVTACLTEDSCILVSFIFDHCARLVCPFPLHAL